MSSVGLIPRSRLQQIPKRLWLTHEYCYFLHDEGVRLLKDYEAAKATTVKIKFRNRKDAAAFAKLAPEHQAIDALRATGYPDEARRVVLNSITMAMVSDVLQHLFEALRCLERRKTVVALNLLRKPLTDSLIYLAWMLGDEDGFYAKFTAGDPGELTHSKLGNRRLGILRDALDKTAAADFITPESLLQSLFDPAAEGGLYGLFQHAVHLVTVQRMETRTTSENFNFIFKSPTDDDIYDSLYAVLPDILLFLSHVIMELFQRIAPSEPGGRRAFEVRSTYGFVFVARPQAEAQMRGILAKALNGHLNCGGCGAPASLTPHNAARAVLSESHRCTRCHRVQDFPFSWFF